MPDRRQLARARTGAGRHAGPARSHRTTTCRGAVPPGGRLRRDDEGRHRRVGPKFQGGDRPPARGRTRLGSFLDSDSVDRTSGGAPSMFFLHTSRQRQMPSSYRDSFAPGTRFGLRGVCAVPFFGGPPFGRHPAVRSGRPSAGPQGPCGRSIFRTKEEYPVAAALRCKPGANRAVAGTQAVSCREGDGRTTAAVCRAARPRRSATACAFRPQAA